jgi:hypothetical protein
LRSIPTEEEIVLSAVSAAVVAKQLLVQCVSGVLPPRNEVAGCNADSSHPVQDQEHVEPNHFRLVRLHGVKSKAKRSDNSALSSYCILGLYRLTQQGTRDNPCYRNVKSGVEM